MRYVGFLSNSNNLEKVSSSSNTHVSPRLERMVVVQGSSSRSKSKNTVRPSFVSAYVEGRKRRRKEEKKKWGTNPSVYDKFRVKSIRQRRPITGYIDEPHSE